MIKQHFVTAATAAGLLLASTLSAASDWKGVGEAGLVIVEGNSESQVLNANLTFENESEKWDHKLRLAATSAESDGEKDAESYTADWDTQYYLTERSFVFGDLRYFDDKFDSFEAIYSGAVGLGYRVVKTEAISWKTSAGAGYRQTELEETGEEQSGVNYLFISDYKHKLTDTTTLTNETRVEVSEDNTFTQNIFGLSVAINSSLAMKFAYELRYNSEPAEGDENTDSITSVNLVYNF